MKNNLCKLSLVFLVLSILSACGSVKTVSAQEEAVAPHFDLTKTAIATQSQKDKKEEKEEKETAEQTPETAMIETAEKRREIVWETIEDNDIQKEVIKDETLFEGEEVLMQKGQKGIVKIAYELSYLDDELISKNQTGEKEIIQELKNEIVHVGTKSIQGNFNKDLSMKILEETNYYRNEQGNHSLQWDETLYNFAKIRAEEISRLFSHTRPDGQAWDSVDDRVMGENLAKGYHKANLVVKAWVDSPGHRENLLRNYSKMASACFEDASGHMFIVQLFGY